MTQHNDFYTTSDVMSPKDWIFCVQTHTNHLNWICNNNIDEQFHDDIDTALGLLIRTCNTLLRKVKDVSTDI